MKIIKIPQDQDMKVEVVEYWKRKSTTEIHFLMIETNIVLVKLK